MLSEIKLVEVSTNSIQFKHTPVKGAANKGNFEANIGEITVEIGKKLKSDEDTKVLEIHASPTVIGTSEDSTQETFNLTFGLRLVFTYPASTQITSQMIDESQWFFEYNVKLFFKSQCEQILKATTIRNIELPFS